MNASGLGMLKSAFDLFTRVVKLNMGFATGMVVLAWLTIVVVELTYAGPGWPAFL